MGEQGTPSAEDRSALQRTIDSLLSTNEEQQRAIDALVEFNEITNERLARLERKTAARGMGREGS